MTDEQRRAKKMDWSRRLPPEALAQIEKAEQRREPSDARKGVPQPVAWMYWNEPDIQRHFTNLRELIGSYWTNIVPLYAAPAQAEAREPDKCIACPDSTPGRCDNCPEDDPNAIAEVASIIADAVTKHATPAARVMRWPSTSREGMTVADSKMVPREPTEDMVNAVGWIYKRCRKVGAFPDPKTFWQAMYDAAPAATDENARLREALRERVVFQELDFVSRCYLCGCTWPGRDERHVPGCLASTTGQGAG